MKELSFKKKLMDKKMLDIKFATSVYSNLCNQVWFNKDDLKIICYSWRSAGGLVANIRHELDNNINENYLDFYCSGKEGSIKKTILKFFKSLNIELLEDYYDNVEKHNNYINQLIRDKKLNELLE